MCTPLEVHTGPRGIACGLDLHKAIAGVRTPTNSAPESVVHWAVVGLREVSVVLWRGLWVKRFVEATAVSASSLDRIQNVRLLGSRVSL